jgi:sulfur carrier protein
MDNTTLIKIILNGEPREIYAGWTLADLVAAVAKSPKGVAIEHNGEIVPRSAHADTGIAAEDQIELVQFVGGG